MYSVCLFVQSLFHLTCTCSIHLWNFILKEILMRVGCGLHRVSVHSSGWPLGLLPYYHCEWWRYKSGCVNLCSIFWGFLYWKGEFLGHKTLNFLKDGILFSTVTSSFYKPTTNGAPCPYFVSTCFLLAVYLRMAVSS